MVDVTIGGKLYSFLSETNLDIMNSSNHQVILQFRVDLLNAALKVEQEYVTLLKEKEEVA